ncbi:MAG: RtcB family protein, partial [Oscillospiraceae bacterium]|nr:RtcB family protein [Oscillospiraceae bacterium]
MIEVNGLFNTALCYTPALEAAAGQQIKAVCDQEAFAGCRIRIMPDVHAGKGCTIGTTMTIKDKIVPGMVGVDIGCGMETVRLAEREIDFSALDALIRKEIPSGQNVRRDEHPLNEEIDLSQLRCAPYVSIERAKLSIGTLGGGNHFIEVDRADNGDLFLVVHSGSRHLGTQVCRFYQDQGRFAMWGGARHQIEELIAKYRAAGRLQEIQSALKELRREHPISVPKELAYVEGRLFEDYIHDMRITQQFALLNRKAMTDVILHGMGLTKVEEFTTIHNYIDTEKMILR